MQIIWYGQSCFVVKSKLQDQEINILINPFDSKKIAKADIVLLNNKILNPKELKNCKAFVIDSAGEFEIRNNFIRGINNDENIIFLLEAEGINIVNLGKTKHLENGLINKLQNVDILILPINKDEFFSVDEAGEIINQIEPKIVIPSYYQEIKNISKFAEKMGVDMKKTVDKLKIVKKNLLQDGAEIIIMDKKS
ncbi:MAG: MBL fold metallo-hydrolase [Patescibacteria group bacterium]|nr:MBL fold metallo-hydrolase [Patescibacteria group bacterium]